MVNNIMKNKPKRLLNLEYKNILVYKSYEGEENPLNLSNFEEQEVYVNHEFRHSITTDAIWGEAKVYKGIDNNTLFADIVIYMSEETTLTPFKIELLVPCIGGRILRRDNRNMVDFKLTSIGLCKYNINKEIRSLGKQINLKL